MSTISTEDRLSDLGVQDEVILYPTFGHRAVDGRSWKVGFWGTIFEPNSESVQRRVMLNLLRRFMKAEPEEFQSELFRTRIRHFLVRTERGRHITLHVGDRMLTLQRPSKRSGHFRGHITLSPEETEQLSDDRSIQDDRLTLRVATAADDERHFFGEAQLIEREGVSVISDIDDTIKESQVADRRVLLWNTFLKEFRAVDGMSDLYRRWQADGAAFHYVSSSPWQLYICLRQLLDENEFPQGSYHLRSIRMRDPSVLRMFAVRRHSKRRVINSLVKIFPQRSFVLVGDSGEKDPEIYGNVARRFPKQITSILIRRVPGRAVTRERIAKAFKHVPTTKWRFFDSPSELHDIHFVNGAQNLQ